MEIKARRAQQVIDDDKRLRDCLRETAIGYLGMAGPDGPYVVPVNFVLDGQRVLIHSALQGTKIDLIRRDPRVCLAAVPRARYLQGQGNYSYESVLVYGRAHLVEGSEEKRRAYLRLIGRYDPSVAGSLTEACIEGSVIIAIEIERLTGKKGSQDE